MLHSVGQICVRWCMRQIQFPRDYWAHSLHVESFPIQRTSSTKLVFAYHTFASIWYLLIRVFILTRSTLSIIQQKPGPGDLPPLIVSNSLSLNTLCTIVIEYDGHSGCRASTQLHTSQKIVVLFCCASLKLYAICDIMTHLFACNRQKRLITLSASIRFCHSIACECFLGQILIGTHLTWT